MLPVTYLLHLVCLASTCARTSDDAAAAAVAGSWPYVYGLEACAGCGRLFAFCYGCGGHENANRALLAHSCPMKDEARPLIATSAGREPLIGELTRKVRDYRTELEHVERERARLREERDRLQLLRDELELAGVAVSRQLAQAVTREGEQPDDPIELFAAARRAIVEAFPAVRQ